MAYLRCTGTPGGSLKLRTAQGEIASFETNIVDLLQEVKCELTPSLDGYSAVNLTACGVNLWDEEWEYVNSKVTSKNYIPVAPNTVYLFGNSKLYDIYMFDKSKNSLGNPTYTAVTGGFLFTTANNCAFINFSVANSYGTTYNNDISINYPATDTQYHPYTGNTYAIALGDTYYGGTLDVTNGTLTVTYGQVNLGSLAWVKDTTTIVGQTFFMAMLSDANNAFKAICSDYPFVGSYSYLVDKSCAYVYNTRIAIMDSDYDTYTTDDFKTAMSGKYLTYELATPFDIDLTPQQIEALLGVNNVWHDGNGDTEVKYLYNA